MYSFIDTLTYPFRWLAARILDKTNPEFYDRVVNDTSWIVRRVMESAVDDVGLEAGVTEIKAALNLRMVQLKESRPEDYRTLNMYIMLNGAESGSQLWIDALLASLDRRVQ